MKLPALLLFTALCICRSVAGQGQKMVPQLDLYSHWNGHKGYNSYNSLWGWSGNGKEYAILGTLDSIYFFDISTPGTPKRCDAKAGKFNDCVHREFKTYKHYCYAIGDEGSSSLQIFDMSYLPDSVHKVYDSDTLFSNAHNLFFDHDRMYAAFPKRTANHKTNAYAMLVASVQNPEAPELISILTPPFIVINGNKQFNFDYVHDMYVRNDTAWCACGYGGLYVYNYADPINPYIIGSYTADLGSGFFNHSCWLSPDGNALVNAYETSGAKVRLFDVSQLKDSSNHNPHIELDCLFGSNAEKNSVAHNPFMKDGLIYMSYYYDGVVVFDMKDPMHVQELTSYDTYPQNGDTYGSSFQGCWNVYPYFSSGLIIASDISNGLFVLRMDSVNAIDARNIEDKYLHFSIQNPFFDVVEAQVRADMAEDADISLSDVSGRTLYHGKIHFAQGENRLTLPCPALHGSFVLLTINTKNGCYNRKLIKV